MKSLLELYECHDGKVSDKWSLYLTEYDRLFKSYRELPISLLEIGVQNGGSLEIWSQYFANGIKFVGCDINPDCQKLTYDDPRIAVIVGDATTNETQQKIHDQSATFDLIIEDGSHTSGDIVKAFARYFPLLKEGGLFVAEDLHCSYWQEFEGGIFHPYSSINFFKHLADIINHEHWGVDRDRTQLLSGFKNQYQIDLDENLLSQIHSIEFINSICVIRKSSIAKSRLGSRFVTGLTQLVFDEILKLKDSQSRPPSQSSNKFSGIALSPLEQYIDLNKDISERDQRIVDLNKDISERNQRIVDLNKCIQTFENSYSWRITKPLRFFRAIFLKYFLSKPPIKIRRLSNNDNFLSKRKATFLPDDFDTDCYLILNPDVAKAKFDAAKHFVSHGAAEGRGYKSLETIWEGTFIGDRKTILIVSHEASRTGAPVLSLNLVQEYSKKFNVVVLLLGDGVLKKSFVSHNASVFLLISEKYLASAAIDKLTKRFNFKFAIVNSIESRVVLDGLNKNGVPAISLIHEFASYTRPEDAFPAALFWSSEVVFSANIVRENAFLTYPHLSPCPTHIIPQGRCLLPVDDVNKMDIDKERDRIRALMRPKDLDPDTKIILGAGFVQMRKGIDLFVECATRVVRSPGGEKCRFVWVGKGYDPEKDIAYSVYIKDQIERAGLQKHIFFIDETPAIEAAYEEADLFLLSSRLDPLPNVAIEVMSYGVPVLCFNKTTGIADFLIESGLEEACVAQYIDTAEMAQKILSLLNSESLYQQIAKQCQHSASQYFDMKEYCAKLEQLGENARTQMEQDKLDSQTILESGLLKKGFGTNGLSSDQSFNASVFLLSWKNGMGRRKPHPGFHPGIYLEQHGLASRNVDPFADYLRSGQPKGPWNYPVITSQSNKGLISAPENKRVALHIHAYYPELFPQIIDALLNNKIRPDLFVSVRDQQGKEKIIHEMKRYQGVRHDIRIVPNRGRDIGPFLTEFGKGFLEGYDFVGHIHTKKSVDIKDAQTGSVWYQFVLANLLGTKQHPMADAVLTELNINSSIGMVFPDDPNIVGWGKNKKFAMSLAERMGVESLPVNFLFPVGTMFWARTQALKPFFNLNLSWEDYPPEPLPYDGSTLHALERLLGFPAKGYQVATAYMPGVTR